MSEMQNGAGLPPNRGLAAMDSDEDLVARCRKGQEAAWGMLVERYERLVYTVPRKFKLTPEEASEIFDGVFAELWRSLDRLDDPGQLRAWLVTTARRRSLAQVHYKRRWADLAELDGPAAVDPVPSGDPVLLQIEQQQEMRTLLVRLPVRCQRVLMWLFYSDPAPTYEEIGKRLGLSGSSIGFLRRNCLRLLRQEWDAWQRTK